MADNDEPEVSRRQFFRGLTGDLLKIVGEVTGLAGETESESEPRVVNLKDGDVFISPEKQEATLNDLFGFLEQLGAQEEERRQAEAEPAEADPHAETLHEAEAAPNAEPS